MLQSTHVKSQQIVGRDEYMNTPPSNQLTLYLRP